MDDFIRLRNEREAKRRRFLCEECGYTVIEGSVCETEKDPPQGEPKSGRKGKIHIDPKRDFSDSLCRHFEGKLSPTDSEFAAAVRTQLEISDAATKRVLDELFAQADARSSKSKNSQSPAVLPSEVLTPAMLDDALKRFHDQIATAIALAQQEIFTKDEAAKFLKVSVSTIEKQVALGKLRRSGNARVWRFRKEDLQKYAALNPPTPRKK